MFQIQHFRSVFLFRKTSFVFLQDVAENLHFAAAKNVTLHLGKLHRETKVGM